MIVDEVGEHEILARSQYDAPEVDGLVIVEPGVDVNSGDWLRVRVMDSNEHDLYAEAIT